MLSSIDSSLKANIKALSARLKPIKITKQLTATKTMIGSMIRAPLLS